MKNKKIFPVVLAVSLGAGISFAENFSVSAGKNIIAKENSSVVLEGSSNGLNYLWIQRSGVDVVLHNEKSRKVAFQLPQLRTNAPVFLSFELQVENAEKNRAVDVVYVAVVHENKKPQAHVKDIESCETGSPVFLDATESTDPDADDLNFTWQQTEGTPVVLAGPVSSHPVFICPELNNNPRVPHVAFQLNAEDQSSVSSTTSVRLYVTNTFERIAGQMQWSPKQEEASLLFKTMKYNHRKKLEEEIKAAAQRELELAQAFLDKNEFSQALKSSEKALTLFPSSTEALKLRREIKTKQKIPFDLEMAAARKSFVDKDYLSVIRHIKQAQAADPTSKEASAYLDLCFAELEQQSNAQFDSSLQKKQPVYGIVKDANESRKLYSRGLSFYANGNSKEAAKVWEKAIQLDGDNRLALNAYSRVLKESAE